MKKFLIFLLVGICLSIVIPSKYKEGVLSLVEDANRVCFVSSEKLEVEEVESVFSGDLVFNYCSLGKAKELIGEVQSNLEGIHFEFEEKSEAEILSVFKGEKVYEEVVDGIRIVYCFSPYYQKCITLNGEKVNMQIAFKDSELIVGFPLILTGY